MNSDPQLWLAFARMFGALFAVLAVFLMVFYFFRRFSGAGGAKRGQGLIEVLAVHHLAPKEKLVLVRVADRTLLIGVGQAGMSKLATLKGIAGPTPSDPPQGFARVLAKKLGRPSMAPNARSQEPKKDG